MTDFSGAFSDLIPAGGGSAPAPAPQAPDGSGITITPLNADGTPANAPAPSQSASPDFSNAFSDLIPQKVAPAPTLMDRAKQFAGGMVKSLADTASAGGQAAQIEMGQPVDVPNAAQTDAAIQKNVTGPLPAPAPGDRLGNFLYTTGEFVGNPTSYIGPGSLPAKAGMAVLAGLGSEAGGQLAQGTPYEVPARLAGAALGGGAGALIARPGAVTAAIGPAPSSAAPTVEDLEAAYKAVRTNPDVKNAVIPIQDVKDLATTAEGQLLADGYRPTPKSAPGTFGELNRLTPQAPPEPTPLQKLQAEMNWEPLPEQPQVTQATVDDLLAAKRAFRNVANERNPFPDMRPTVDASAASKVIPQLDAVIEEAAPGMKEANANYAKAQAARSLENRFQKAEDQAANANSGLNMGNKIRQAATAAYYNPSVTRGLNPKQMEMLRQVSQGNASRNVIRYVSNLFGGGGGLGSVVVGEVASQHLGPIGWLLSPLGHVLKHVENHLTLRAADKISEAIRSSSPLGEAIQSSVAKWNAARDTFVSGPNSAKFAALSIASRNLSNTLAGAGVNIHPTLLLRSVKDSQGPVNSSAQQEQR